MYACADRFSDRSSYLLVHGIMLSCQICGALNLPTLSMLLSHIKIMHACEPGFSVQCNLQGCKRTFRNFSTFRNHVYTFHDEQAAANSNLDVVDVPPLSSDVDSDNDTSCDEDVDCDQDSGLPNAESAVSEEVLQRSAALWILKTRDTHRIPQSVIDGIIADLSSLFECSLAGIASKVRCSLADKGVTDNVLKSVLTHLDVDSPFSDIFRGLKTHHQQLKYFKEEFNLIVSVATKGVNSSFKIVCVCVWEGGGTLWSNLSRGLKQNVPTYVDHTH